MSNTNNGGPAFPAFEHHAGYGQMMAVGGMTMRDYFAAKAMQGLAQNIDWNIKTTDGVAGVSYALADAMIRARNGK
jgi:hypothetical protein